MQKFASLYRAARHLGPRTTLEKAVGLLARKTRHCIERARDAVLPTHVAFDELENFSQPKLRRCLLPLNLPPTFPVALYDKLSQNYLSHHFDLLGSGWRQVRHGMQCKGLDSIVYDSGNPITGDVAGAWLLPRINRANLPGSLAAWRMIEHPYIPIDWQLDFKSGYRWSEKTWHSRVPFGHLPGVDIKVPWELARMQHLPQLALAYAAAMRLKSDSVVAAKIAREFRNQILDFIATNPPRFGVNWKCPMDVGIRAANWALAFDLFCAAGWSPDAEFERQLMASLLAHGRYIVQNLEWRRKHRGNHYLANVAGLLFISRYLPPSPETQRWLRFAASEVTNELLLQFTGDGANFEASTCYHRLSAEMAVYSAAWINATPELAGDELLTEQHWQLIGKMAEFTRDVTKPSGAIHQIGDNDSGRFFKLQPAWLAAEATGSGPHLFRPEMPLPACVAEENHLDHRSLVAAIGTLLRREDLLEFSGEDWADVLVLRHLQSPPVAAKVHAAIATPSRCAIKKTERATCSAVLSELQADANLVSREFRLKLPREIVQLPRRTVSYPDFGVYLWRNERLYLAIRCGPIGQQDNGGHAHNDQLAIELQVDGEDWLLDPGTFIYTALPRERNAYRSVAAHFAPRLQAHREPGCLEVGLFQLGNEARAQALAFDEQGFVGRHFGYGLPVYRAIVWQADGVLVRDFSDRAQPLAPVDDVECRPHCAAQLAMSPGYGLRKAA